MRSERTQDYRHSFGGGLATDYGTNAPLTDDRAVTGADGLDIPYLTACEDVTFKLNGGIRKLKGAKIANATAMDTSGGGADDTVIRNIFGYWRDNLAGTRAQKIIAIVDDEVWTASVSDFIFTLENSPNALTTGSGDVITRTVMNNDLYIADSSGGAMLQYDQTTLKIANLTAGATGATEFGISVPPCSIVVTHKNHLFTAGDPANPSTVSVSPFLTDSGPDGDWGLKGSTIEVSPEDGDAITAMISFRDSLFVFKGPSNGSIWRITGSQFNGAFADLRMAEFARGIGCVSANGVFSFGNDVGFIWQHGTVRSLAATDKFGDFETASLSLGLNDNFFRQRVNNAAINLAWTTVDPNSGHVLIGLPIDGSSRVNCIMAMDYRFPQAPRWMYWKGVSNFSELGTVIYPAMHGTYMIDTSNGSRGTVLIAGSDGYVRKLGQSNRKFELTPGVARAISPRVRTPYLSYGTTRTLKTINGASIGSRVANTSTINFSWTRDKNATQTKSVTITGGNLLGGPNTDDDLEFILGDDVRGRLGGDQISPIYFDLPDGDEFRQISYEIMNSQEDPDIEIDDFSVLLTFNSDSEEAI